MRVRPKGRRLQRRRGRDDRAQLRGHGGVEDLARGSLLRALRLGGLGGGERAAQLLALLALHGKPLQLQLVRAVGSDQLGCQLLELRFGHQADRQLKRHLVAFREAADARPLVVTQPMKLSLRGLHLALCGTDLLQRPLHRLQHGVLLTAHLHQERGAVGRELRSLPARLLRGDELRRHAAQ